MEVWWWKIKRNLPLYTYPAVAGYLQRGNVATKKWMCGGGKAIEKQFFDLLDLWEEWDESDDFINVYKMYIRGIVYQ